MRLKAHQEYKKPRHITEKKTTNKLFLLITFFIQIEIYIHWNQIVIFELVIYFLCYYNKCIIMKTTCSHVGNKFVGEQI